MHAVKQDLDAQQKQGQELTEKLDLMENEIRMLLINSVTDQLPE